MEQEKLKLGVLFSQSGPMAVTEHAHLQGVLLACEEINEAGGVGGRHLDPIILDPKGDDRRYAELAAELLLKHQANCIIGCCLSSSRKAVLPVIERFNGVLFYPSVYEGFEYTPNVIYGGAVPNQMVIPLLEYIFEHHGRRIALLGSDTLYAREINRIVKEFLGDSGGDVVAEKYFRFGVSGDEVQLELNRALEHAPDVIISTVVGEDSVTLYSAYDESDDLPKRPPIASLTTTESELDKVNASARAGHLAVSPYFASMKSLANRKFVDAFQNRFGQSVQPSVYSEVTYALVHFFANATKITGRSDTDSILSALSGAVLKAPSGDLSIDLDTNHFALRPMVGMSNDQGHYEVLWKSLTPIEPDPYLVSYDRTVNSRGAI